MRVNDESDDVNEDKGDDEGFISWRHGVIVLQV